MTEFSPGPLALANILSQLFGAELVVDKAAEGDGIAESLETGDLQSNG